MSDKKIPLELIEVLASGDWLSGEAVGEHLGVSRAAVWKKLQGLEQFGLQLEAAKGKGYRLQEPVSLLKEELLVEQLEQRQLAYGLAVHSSLDSTNAEILRQLESNAEPMVVLAEMQTAGRGRRGRSWLSPFAKNVYFSMLRSFQTGVASLDGLSLVVGLALIDVLKSFGLEDAKLKWPNDVLVGNKKLAGILLELSGDPTGLCHVIIGIGVNVNMKNAGGGIDQPWVAMSQLLDLTVDRNALVVEMVVALEDRLKRFESEGFSAFVDEWNACDAFSEKDVVVTLGEQRILGLAQGVTDKGELLLKTDTGVRVFNGGEVSLRRQM